VVVGQALRLLEADPAHPWTVEALAAEAGVSRAALARRFTALVGQPPRSYLRERRIALAAELLRRPEATLAAVAGRVGFSSAFALSVAFKKARGMSQSDLLHELAAGHPFALSELIKPPSPTSRTSRRTGGS
jgi:AraC-like DNA-binding protein